MSGDHHRRPLAELRDQRDAAELNLLGARQENDRLAARVRTLEAGLYETLTRWTELTEYEPHPVVLKQVAKGEVSRILVALAPGPRSSGE